MNIEPERPKLDEAQRPLVSLVPCSGLSERGILPGHVHVPHVGRSAIGPSLPLEELKEKYPHYVVSTSDTLCESCAAAWDQILGI